MEYLGGTKEEIIIGPKEKEEIKKEIERQKRDRYFGNSKNIRDYLELCFNAKRIDPEYFNEKDFLKKGDHFFCDDRNLRKTLEQSLNEDTNTE